MQVQKDRSQNIISYSFNGEPFFIAPKSCEQILKDKLGGVFNDDDKVAYFNDVYLNALDRDEYFNILCGGSGGGKSEFKAASLLIECLTKPYFRCMFARKFGQTVRSTQFQLFKDIIYRYNWLRFFKINETDMTIKCLFNNNYLKGQGLDDVHKLTSMPAYSDVWIEEPLSKTKNAGEDVGEKEFMELIRRLRGTDSFKVHIHLTFNPVSKLSWIYNLFFNDDITDENYDTRYESFKDRTFILKTTYRDNYFIDRSEYEKSLNLNDAYDFKIFANGEWGLPKADDPAFWNFVYSKHIGNCREIDYSLPIYVSSDQNIGIMATTIIQWSKEQKKIWIRREMPKCQDNISLKQRIKESDFYIEKRQNIIMTGDASGKNKHHMSNETFYDYMSRELLIDKAKIVHLDANLEHFDSLNNINRGFVEYDVIIDKACVNVVSDMQSTSKTSESKIDKKKHDPHFGDTIRYFFDSVVYRKSKKYISSDYSFTNI